jgi:tRNA (mo5U34)-methyltransferase
MTLPDRVAAIEWYHTLELAPGVVTPGWFDHRPVLSRIPLPARLDGKLCLDVGTFNGYWAFEMERRGGSVTAIDVLDPSSWDWPAGSSEQAIEAIARRQASGDGFAIAQAALSSTVNRLPLSVYDLDPDEVGRFDVVYVGSLLVHLRDPVRALERVRSVCAGQLILVDGIDLPLTLRSPRLPVARLDGDGRPWWWTANFAGLVQMVRAGGFELTAAPRRLFIPPGEGWRPDRYDWRAMRTRQGRESLIGAWLGDPHGVIVARPRI